MEGWRVDGGGWRLEGRVGWRVGLWGGWVWSMEGGGRGGRVQGVEGGGWQEVWKSGGVEGRFNSVRYSQTCTVRYRTVTVRYGTAEKYC